MARPQKADHDLVAQAIDDISQAGEKPTQRAVARRLGVSRRTVATYWPSTADEPPAATRRIEGSTPQLKWVTYPNGHRIFCLEGSLDGPVAGEASISMIGHGRKDLVTGEPFRDGRTVQMELERQAVASMVAEDSTDQEIADELFADEDGVAALEKVRRRRRLSPP